MNLIPIFSAFINSVSRQAEVNTKLTKLLNIGVKFI